MLDFIRKPMVWKAWDDGHEVEIGRTQAFSIKSMQDLAVYSFLRGSVGRKIAEAGGGKSRVLQNLGKSNECFNLDKFQGTDGGPDKEVHIPGVKNVKTYLSEFSPELEAGTFDAVFSISVVEHVLDARLRAFAEDGARLLKPGGLWVHAIDMYLEDAESPQARRRFDQYRQWLELGEFEPLGPIFDGELRFTADMISNPDNVMHMWGRVAPALTELRQRSQGASLLLAARKR